MTERMIGPKIASKEPSFHKDLGIVASRGRNRWPKIARASLVAALLILTSPARPVFAGNVNTINETIPVEIIDDNPCTTNLVEQIDLKGEIHIVGGVTVDGNGRQHLQSQASYHLSGSDQYGTSYKDIAVAMNNADFPADGSPATSISTQRIISLGSAANYVQNFVIITSIDGSTTVKVQNTHCN